MDPRYEPVRHQAEEYFRQLDAVLCLPLVLNEKLIGLINLGRKTNLKRFSIHDYQFLSHLKNQATIALSNSLVYGRVEELVEIKTEELVQTQQQLFQAEKLATIGILAGGVAHEINNPLTAVLTNTQILKTQARPEDLELFNLIEEGVRRCQTIIQKLLKYSRKPPKEGVRESADIRQVIQSAFSLLAYQLQQENIELVLELEDIPLVGGIPNELEQVFTNLFLNSRDAIKAAERKGEIRVKGALKDKRVEVQVMDNGIGIKKEHLNKIFDPFFTTKDVGKGTGLGLAVSYKILEKHHCQVEVKSEEGIGSTFILRFAPAHEGAADNSKPMAQRHRI